MKVEVSLGEIVDKYTILKIKKERATNDQQLENIAKEFKYLEKMVFKINCPENLIEELYLINKRLWDIEDLLRILENKKDFSKNFIELARQVYITNDKRYLIKNKINNLLSSNFKEEKILPKY